MQQPGSPSSALTLSDSMELAFMLGVREAADLPAYSDDTPEPLLPAPPSLRWRVPAEVRKTSARQWSAWWRIGLAHRISLALERQVAPAPPTFDLPTVPVMDPPKFGSLAPTPELQQLTSSAWVHLAEWRGRVATLDLPHSLGTDLFALAEARARRPLGRVSVTIELLPVGGTRCWSTAEDVRTHTLFVLASAGIAEAPTTELIDAVIRTAGVR